MWRKDPFFLVEYPRLKFIETGATEIIPPVRDGWCEEVGTYDAEEYNTSKKPNDIFFRFPRLFVVFRDIWGSDEDSEEEWEIHRDTIPDDPVRGDDEEEYIEACKNKIQKEELGSFFVLLESERKIDEWEKREKGYIEVSSWEIFGREEVCYNRGEWAREEVGVFKSEHRHESDDPVWITVGEEEEDNRDEHEIEWRDFCIFSRLIGLHREVEWEFEIVIDPVLISEVPTEIFVLWFSTRGHHFCIRFVFDFFEFICGIYFGIVDDQTLTLPTQHARYSEIAYSKLRYIFDDPWEGRESDSSQEYEWYEKCLLKGNSLVLIESKGKEENRNSYRNSGYREEEIRIVFRIVDIELRPESCLGEDRHKEREKSEESSESELGVEDESEHSEDEHKGREFDRECKSDNSSEDEHIGEIFVLAKEMENTPFRFLICSFETLSVADEEIDDPIDSDNRDEKESRIEFHIFCLLEYNHRHRIKHGCSKEGEIDETFFVSTKETLKCDGEDDNREDSSDLIKEKGKWSWVKHKSDSREYLPRGHTHSLEDGPVIGHNLWVVHIDSEIIPSDWHRSDDIDEAYPDEIGEDEEKHLCGDEWEIDLFEKSSVWLMSREFDPVCPEIFEGCENLSVRESRHNGEDSKNTPDIVEFEYPEYDKCGYEFDESESEREKESKRRLFFMKLRHEPTKCHISEAVHDEDGDEREEKISDNLKKQNKSAICSTDEPEIDEAEDGDMEEGIESDRERRKRSFWLLGRHGDIFIDGVGDEDCDDIWCISRPGFIMETDIIILCEDKNRKNNKSEKLSKVGSHDKRVLGIINTP